jgi:hypothetical protein
MLYAIERVFACWFLLNLAVPAVIIYRRSPRMRHKLFRWTVGGSASLRDRVLAHALVQHARH